MLRPLDGDRRAQLLGRLVDVEAAQQLANRRRADVGVEGRVALVLRLLAERQVLLFVEQLVRHGRPASPGSMTM